MKQGGRPVQTGSEAAACQIRTPGRINFDAKFFASLKETPQK